MIHHHIGHDPLHKCQKLFLSQMDTRIYRSILQPLPRTQRISCPCKKELSADKQQSFHLTEAKRPSVVSSQNELRHLNSESYNNQPEFFLTLRCTLLQNHNSSINE